MGTEKRSFGKRGIGIQTDARMNQSTLHGKGALFFSTIFPRSVARGGNKWIPYLNWKWTKRTGMGSCLPSINNNPLMGSLIGPFQSSSYPLIECNLFSFLNHPQTRYLVDQRLCIIHGELYVEPTAGV
jgi:hypothetical protein